MGLVLFELKFSLFFPPFSVIPFKECIHHSWGCCPPWGQGTDDTPPQSWGGPPTGHRNGTAPWTHHSCKYSLVATFCYDLYMAYCIAVVLTLEFYLVFGYFCIKVNLGLQTKYRKLKMHLNFYVFCVYFFTRFCFVDLSGSVWKWMCETTGQRYRESTETCR